MGIESPGSEPTGSLGSVVELSLEYSKRTRKVAVELVIGISESLGLEESYIHKALDMDSGLQIFVANLYPPCPQPKHAMGIPPYSDHGVLTLLIQNEIEGLQVQHNGKWVNVNPLPNSFLVNTAHHLEILSNGKYKSVLHRAVVNNKATRISLAMGHGPSLDTVVGPTMELVNSETHPAACIPMKYKDYLEMEQVGPAMEIMDSENRLDACIPIKYKDYLEMKQNNQLDAKYGLESV
ncbi:2-oxoglutarate-dependent dioxygenase 19-like [Cornus florida]|uniref:2-oxoglutarate-dependent dioxygenase 19-like n=1 Tax=Cornus florida TaxID=4283 RepID=UPI0028A2089F|nr:2-oxoglutarate-dependent dioxygenase 19-like [Cornus florida]